MRRWAELQLESLLRLIKSELDTDRTTMNQ